jgi:WD40 repeat protein
VKDYGKIHGMIKSIAITSDDKYLWTSDFEENSHFKQFSVRHGQMIKDYGAIFQRGVRSIITTPDKKYIFAASYEGYLKQISPKSQEVVHDYGKIHTGSITCLETTRDSKWLITGS